VGRLGPKLACPGRAGPKSIGRRGLIVDVLITRREGAKSAPSYQPRLRARPSMYPSPIASAKT
jgi:hypothetical protein